MATRAQKELKVTLSNLKNGWRLARFDSSAIRATRVSAHQVVALATLSLVVSGLVEFADSLPSPKFSPWGFATETATLCVVLLVGYLVSVWNRNKSLLLKFVVAAYSVIAVFTLFVVVLRLLYALPFPRFGYYAWWIYILWFYATLLFVLHRFNRGEAARTVPQGLIGAVGFALVFALHAPMWFQKPTTPNAARLRLNEEIVFNSQIDLLQATQRSIRRARHGVTEMYFVGFAGYGGQDVFRREVQFIRNLFDRRFGTEGRSVALINNRDTVNTVPLATGSNLKRVLKMVAGKMNRDEDVLFLYFTSHGSQKEGLSVKLWPLGLNDMTPHQLKTALDEAGIRWRVLLVSACYSGGFIAPFQDDRTLVVTASAADRQSFGCSNERDFTYFGEAVFRDALSESRQFIPALERAIVAIREREQREKLDPSNPQMHVGRLVPAKLRQIERRLFPSL